MNERSGRIGAVAAGVLLGAVGLALREPALVLLNQASPGAPTVVLFVMDTVRADHLSACGYHRPTSPSLQALVAAGASLSCDAVSPSAWTAPSHASYFTGLHVPAHGVHFTKHGAELSFGPGTPVAVRPLDPHHVTLAEHFRDQGYQTAIVTSNRFVSDLTGLDQGFEVKRWSAGPWWNGERVVQNVIEMLREELELDRPLFLVVNVTDAHAPWQEIPTGVGWVPPRTPPDRSTLDQHVDELIDVYDYGTFLEDRALGSVLDGLRRHGWDRAGLRLVVVSDHGELLGEHGLFDHAKTLYRPVVRVPLLVYTEPGPSPQLPPGTISAIAAHGLLRDGSYDPPEHVFSAIYPVGDWATERYPGVVDSSWGGLWMGDTKLVWHHGRTHRYRLSADPDEAEPLDAGRHPALPHLERFVDRMLTSAERPPPENVHPDLLKHLEVMGYVE